MTPQGMGAPPQQESWFAKNWKWLAAVGCLVPTLCCGSFGVLGLIMPDDNSARVDCGTPGPGGVDCDVVRTAGTGSLEACWDLEITCSNQGVMSSHACGGINAGKNSAKVNMPVTDFSNQEACDAPESGAVANLNVRTVE